MRILLLSAALILTACSGNTHYAIDNPYHPTSVIGRRPLKGPLVKPGVIKAQITDEYIGQPVRSPDGEIVGYVTGKTVCGNSNRVCATFKE